MSTLLDQASLILTPNAYKAGTLYSVKPEDGVGDFDFTRATTATRVNSAGLIETVATGVPRLDYPFIDGVVQGCPSLLLEPARTNLVAYSEAFDNAYWTKNNSTVVGGFISPDGTANAFKLVENTSTAGHSVFRNSSTVTLSSHSFSCFVKTNGRNVKLDFFGGTNNAIFDLTNGTVISANGTGLNAKIETLSNGWYRCSITQVQTSTTIYPNILCVDDSNESTYTGDGTSGVYIYGAQLEAGSYATSYIPTSGSTVTRNADVANGAGDASTFNDSEGVLMAEISALADDLTNRRISISNGTTSDDNRINLMYTAASNQITINYKASGTTRVSFSYVLKDVKDYNKVLMLYKSGDFRFYVNGFKLDTDSNTTMIADGTLSELAFEDAQNINNFYGNTKQVLTFKEALTDSELENLTSWDSFIELAQGQQYIIY